MTAKKQGYNARMDGDSLKDNPYPKDGLCKTHWRIGYKEAKAHIIKELKKLKAAYKIADQYKLVPFIEEGEWIKTFLLPDMDMEDIETLLVKHEGNSKMEIVRMILKMIDRL